MSKRLNMYSQPRLTDLDKNLSMVTELQFKLDNPWNEFPQFPHESKFYSFYNDNNEPNHLYSLNWAPFSTLKKTQNFDKMFRKFVTTYNIFPGRKSPVRQKRDFEKWGRRSNTKSSAFDSFDNFIYTFVLLTHSLLWLA